jgi:hypothetical protein
VKDDAERVALARAQTADAVAHRHPIGPAGAFRRDLERLEVGLFRFLRRDRTSRRETASQSPGEWNYFEHWRTKAVDLYKRFLSPLKACVSTCCCKSTE